MKRVFVDANIVIDLLCERYPWFPKVLRIFSMSERAGDQCALSDVSSLSQWHQMTWLISKPKVHEVDITDKLLK